MKFFSALFSAAGKALETTTAVEDSAPLLGWKQPSRVQRMEDHLARTARSTMPFEHVTLSAVTERTKKEEMETLLSSRRWPEGKSFAMKKEVILNPVEKVIEFPAFTGMPFRSVTNKQPWVLLSGIEITYQPAQSVTDSYSKLKIELVHKGNIGQPVQRQIITPSGFGMDGFMCLDYGVHRRDLSLVTVRITLMQTTYREGTHWGSITWRARYETANRAPSVSMRDTLAILRVPDTFLRKRKTSPTHVDLSMDDDDKAELSKRYAKGRIVDYSRPLDKQARLEYSKSEAGSSDGEPEFRFLEPEAMYHPDRPPSPLSEDGEGLYDAPEPHVRSRSSTPHANNRQVTFT